MDLTNNYSFNDVILRINRLNPIDKKTVLNDLCIIDYLKNNLINLLNSGFNDQMIVSLCSDTFLSKLNAENIIYLINNLNEDSSRLCLLENYIVKEKLFTNHYLFFERLYLSFNNINSYNILLKNINKKEKSIVLNGIKDEDYVTKYIIDNLDLKDINTFFLIRNLKEDKNIMKFIDLIDDKYYKSELIFKIKDTNYKMNNLCNMIPNYQIMFLKSLNDETKLFYIKKGVYVSHLISSIENENLLINLFLLQDLDTQKSIIKIINNEHLKFKLFLLIKDKIPNEDDELLIHMIKISSNSKLKNNILKCTKDKGLEDIDYSNYNKSVIIREMDNINLYNTIDSSITFGLEFEAFTIKNGLYISMGKILENWDIKEENTVKNGIEISSPILNYAKESLAQVKYICNFMQKNNFVVNKECGGHIHIGLDSFVNVNQLNALYFIIANCEDVFYAISNRENSKVRTGIIRTSKSVKDIFNYLNDPIFTNEKNFKTYINLIKILQYNDRYFNINILNALDFSKNTIEFRFFNGEIEYEEVHKNILLLLSLVMKCKNISYNEDMSLLKTNDLDIKKEVLFDLLWPYDSKIKEFFEKRYIANRGYYLAKERKL